MYHPAFLINQGGSQFFIMLGDEQRMDGGYSIFGRVIEGMATVDRIGALPITPQDGQPRPYMPLSPVVIKDLHLEVMK